MDLKKIIAVFVFTGLIAAATLIALAEEAAPGAENPVVSVAGPAVSISTPQAPSQNENDTQWAWGEVVNVDGAGKTITVKYLDYETDQERDIVLVVDEKTTFENIKIFDEIKVQDTLSVDYIIGPDGKNIAKNIGLESPDVSAAVTAQAVEDIRPADAQANAEQPAVNPELMVETSAAANAVSGPVTQE
jgi:hypothetical protein